MEAPDSALLGLVFVVMVFAVLTWRLWRLRHPGRGGPVRTAPAAPVGTLQAYLAAFVGVTVGLLAWHLLFDREVPRLQEISYYAIALALASPVARRWQRRFRDWLTRG